MRKKSVAATHKVSRVCVTAIYIAQWKKNQEIRKISQQSALQLFDVVNGVASWLLKYSEFCLECGSNFSKVSSKVSSNTMSNDCGADFREILPSMRMCTVQQQISQKSALQLFYIVHWVKSWLSRTEAWNENVHGAAANYSKVSSTIIPYSKVSIKQTDSWEMRPGMRINFLKSELNILC